MDYVYVHQTLSEVCLKFLKFAMNLAISSCSCQSNCKLENKVVNHQTIGKLQKSCIQFVVFLCNAKRFICNHITKPTTTNSANFARNELCNFSLNVQREIHNFVSKFTV